jgi:hypothetical protein
LLDQHKPDASNFLDHWDIWLDAQFSNDMVDLIIDCGFDQILGAFELVGFLVLLRRLIIVECDRAFRLQHVHQLHLSLFERLDLDQRMVQSRLQRVLLQISLHQRIDPTQLL